VAAIVSIASNSIIIHSVRVNSHMHTTTNYFIVNMAAVDLFITLTNSLFFSIAMVHGFSYFYGRFGMTECILFYVCNMTTIFCSIFTLVFVTIDRYMAVSCPLAYKAQRPVTKYAIALVWFFAFGLTCVVANPYSVKKLPNGKRDCTNPAFLNVMVSTLFGYILPLFVIIVLCVMICWKIWKRKVPGEGNKNVQNAALRTSKKVTYMIFAVIVAFLITWLPTFLSALFVNNTNQAETKIIWTFVYILMYLNGPMNLGIYYIFSENFRNIFKNIFSRM